MDPVVVAALLAALFASVPRVPQPQRGRLAARHDAIVAAAVDAYAAHGVAPAVLLVTAFLETHIGTDDNEGNGWGAPASVRARHVAGTSDHAARALARSFAVCGSWTGAVGRFRSGLCRPWQAAHRAYVRTAMGLVVRVHGGAGVPLPAALR